MTEPIMLASGQAFSNQHRVNVIMWSADNPDGNNHFLPSQRGKTLEYVRECVRTAFIELRPHLLNRYPDYVITVNGWPRHEIGEYSYTVWSKPFSE